ncbi:hypothetical protein TcasGA2_TC013929 [Tribolium castaneum]|uniref:Uncharacterized protein n=1 Tax=Tribolium castaneum TaxID=7070 RepID=D6WNK9_TRICA|nr:hypothetical protein TcasGA2_TC013929 [Tribolium castaneum]
MCTLLGEIYGDLRAVETRMGWDGGTGGPGCAYLRKGVKIGKLGSGADVAHCGSFTSGFDN